MPHDLIRRMAAALPVAHPLVAEAYAFMARATPIDALPLSNRTRLALLRSGYRTVEELRNAGPDRWIARRSIGPVAVKEIIQALSHPLAPAPQPLPPHAAECAPGRFEHAAWRCGPSGG